MTHVSMRGMVVLWTTDVGRRTRCQRQCCAMKSRRKLTGIVLFIVARFVTRRVSGVGVVVDPLHVLQSVLRLDVSVAMVRVGVDHEKCHLVFHRFYALYHLHSAMATQTFSQRHTH